MTNRAKVVAYVALLAIGALLASAVALGAASGNLLNGQGSVPEKDAPAGSTAPFPRPELRVTDDYRVETFPSARNAE